MNAQGTPIKPAGGARRVDRRWPALALTVAFVVVGGATIHGLGSSNEPTPTAEVRPDPRTDPSGHEQAERRKDVRLRFEQAVLMLHAGHYDHALTALHRVLELSPQMPEAHVNMGFALLGLERAAAARDFFEGAMALNPMQANAYYGLAMASDALGDRPAAIGAMRSYLHLAKDQDERHLRKARAALWEWEARPAPSTPPQSEPAHVAGAAGSAPRPR